MCWKRLREKFRPYKYHPEDDPLIVESAKLNEWSVNLQNRVEYMRDSTGNWHADMAADRKPPTNDRLKSWVTRS